MSDKIEQAIKSSSNYCKLPDGTFIQWGGFTLTSGTYSTGFTFPIAFMTRPLFMASPQGNEIFKCYAADGQQAVIGRSDNSRDTTYNWIAIGRWK